MRNLENTEQDIIQNLQAANLDFNQENMPEAEREGYIVSSLKKLANELKDKNTQFETAEEAKANEHKQVQMKFLYDIYAKAFSENFTILHLDDDNNKIIDGLKNLIENLSKTIFEGEGLPDKMSCLVNVIPLHFDDKDNTNAWQREIATKLKLEEVALNFLAGDFNQISYPLEIKMAILMYLDQNSSLVPDDKKSFLTEQIDDFAKELLKTTSISKDLKQAFFKQVKKDYPEETVQSVTVPIQKVDVNSSKPSFWQRLWGSANSPNIDVAINQKQQLDKKTEMPEHPRKLFF